MYLTHWWLWAESVQVECCRHEQAAEKSQLFLTRQVSERIRVKKESLENLGLTVLKNKTIFNLHLLHSIKDSQTQPERKVKSRIWLLRYSLGV